jgi:hypothetical protein
MKRITHVEQEPMDRPWPVDGDVECIRWLVHSLSDPTGSIVKRSFMTVSKMTIKLHELETASNSDQILAKRLVDCTVPKREPQK